MHCCMDGGCTGVTGLLDYQAKLSRVYAGTDAMAVCAGCGCLAHTRWNNCGFSFFYGEEIGQNTRGGLRGS